MAFYRRSLLTTAGALSRRKSRLSAPLRLVDGSVYTFDPLGKRGLQELRRHRHRDHFRLLAGDAGHADRAGDLRQLLLVEAALLQPMPEGGPLGLAADQ